MNSIDFTKLLIEGDQTVTNNGEFVQIIEVFPTYCECAILNINTNEPVSEDIKTITVLDITSQLPYKGLKKYSKA